jgi:hypothetical protein
MSLFHRTRNVDKRIRSRRRDTVLRLNVESLEGRLVLSQVGMVAAPLHAVAQVHAQARATENLSVPIRVTSIQINSVTSNGPRGAMAYTGTMTGTILGQVFSTDVNGTIRPSRGPRGLPSLALQLQPIHLNLLGLEVDTSAIRLDLNARPNGALGRQLGSDLNGVLAAGSTSQAATQLTSVLSDPPILNALNQSFVKAQTRLRSFTSTRGDSSPTINLLLGPANENLAGLHVKLDNGRNRPIRATVSADSSGGLLGKIVSGIDGSGNRRAVTRRVAAALEQVTTTPIPTVEELTAMSLVATDSPTLADPLLLTIDLKPLDLNLLGLEVKTSEIIVTISAQPGSGKLLGNVLTTVANLVNLQGVSNALNNVLANVVTLANASELSVSGVNTGGTLGSTTTVTTTPVLTAHVAPVHLDLLGAIVDTSPIDIAIVAHSGPGQVLGNVITDLANLLNTPPKNGKIDVPYLTQQIHTLNTELNGQIPSIPAAPTTPHVAPEGARNVLSLNVAPINLNLLGLILQTDQIQVNADAQSGSGNLLGNLLSDLLNTLNATPQNLTDLNAEVNDLLAKVVGVLNNTSLTLPADALSGLSQTLQTLALPDLVNTSGSPATAPVLDLNIASESGSAPPIDVNLLGLIVTTSNIHAQLVAQTGDGQVLGNLVYNVSHLLDPGGTLGLLSILNTLGL